MALGPGGTATVTSAARLGDHDAAPARRVLRSADDPRGPGPDGGPRAARGHGSLERAGAVRHLGGPPGRRIAAVRSERHGRQAGDAGQPEPVPAGRAALARLGRRAPAGGRGRGAEPVAARACARRARPARVRRRGDGAVAVLRRDLPPTGRRRAPDRVHRPPAGRPVGTLRARRAGGGTPVVGPAGLPVRAGAGGPQVGPGVRLDAVGLVAAAGAAVSLAAYYLLGARVLRRRDAVSTQAWSMAFAAAFWMVAQPLWQFDPAVLAGDVVLPPALGAVQVPLGLLVAWIVVLGTVVPYALVLAGVARLGPARTGLIGMLEPVAAAATAWVVLGESMTALQVVGGVVVLVGVLLAEAARQSETRRGRRTSHSRGTTSSATPTTAATATSRSHS